MPAPSTPVAIIPDGFDPEKHCGAKKRKSDPSTVCMNVAGFKTTHVGVGRCHLHGGSTPVKHGLYSKHVQSQVLSEAIDEIRLDPALGALDDELSVVKALLQSRLDLYSEQLQDHERAMTLVREGVETDQHVPPAPSLDDLVKLIDAINRLAGTNFNMKFARKYSIPITELEALLGQIASLFMSLCDRYGIGDDAKREFAEGVRDMRVSRPLDTKAITAKAEVVS